jgi:hypothetical protein
MAIHQPKFFEVKSIKKIVLAFSIIMLINAFMEYVVAFYNFSKGLVLRGYYIFNIPVAWETLMILWIILGLLGLMVYESL